MMDAAEVEENLFATSDAKLHGEMCKALSIIYCKVSSIFPSLEAARPRSKAGIEALCSLHVALEKAKNVLQHCSQCSKLYLAITADAVLLKFEKAKSAIKDGLMQVEDIVPRSIACQCQEIVNELDGVKFALDPLEKQVGADLIALLQQGRQCSDSSDTSELECFHQCAIILGITSSREALTERRALKKLIERARAEEDNQKESKVAYLLHLLRKYSKLFKSEISDDNDSQGSAPCSPSTHGSVECSVPNSQYHALEREISKRCSIKLNPINRKSGRMHLPPEELKCPISLQLMYDPVIIVSGQTYERVCIEKWFRDGHSTCPKTQQKLDHLLLIPNYCVKGLLISWCEQNGVPVPDGPPESFDLNYSRLALSEPESTNSKSVNSLSSCKLKGEKVVPLEESSISEEAGVDKNEGLSAQEEDTEQYLRFQQALVEETNYKTKCNVVEQLRILLRDNEEARNFMGSHGFVEALLQFLKSAVSEGNLKVQESGAMALFNLAVNNNRNKAIMLSAGVLPLLEEISNSSSYGGATALYLNLSCLEEGKTKIGKTQAVQFLIRLLQADTEVQCKQDSLHALYNLSTVPSNIPNLLSSGIINGLLSLLSEQGDNDNSMWTEKCIPVLINLAASNLGREEIISTPGLINALAKKLESSELLEQEQAVSCLLVLCNGNEKCSHKVLREGIIPSLVLISVNGTPRAKEKAQKLLMLFKEQRQRDPSPVKTHLCPPVAPEPKKNVAVVPQPETKPAMIKSLSRRIIEKPFRFFHKSKSYSIYHI